VIIIGSIVFADFLIGGPAVELGATILNHDPRFYRTNVPMVTSSSQTGQFND
jgi:hypothetical protein